MLSDEEKQRIEEEEIYRAKSRERIASERNLYQRNKDIPPLIHIRNAKSTTNLRENLDNISFWVRTIVGVIVLIAMLAVICQDIGYPSLKLKSVRTSVTRPPDYV